MWTRSECLRRAALAAERAERVELEIVRSRLLEFAQMWRENAERASDDPEPKAA